MLTSFHSQPFYVISSQTPNGLRLALWGYTLAGHRPALSRGPGEAVQPACPACTLPQAQLDDSPGKRLRSGKLPDRLHAVLGRLCAFEVPMLTVNFNLGME